MHVFLGLGNPGPEYENTRHNVGAWVLSRLSERLSAGFRRAHGCLWAQSTYRRRDILLLRPLEYMNLSGRAAARARRALFPRLDSARMVVIHDDLDLPLGSGRVKLGGGSGGHRGVDSMVHHLGDEGFGRVRVGIDRPPEGVEPTNYVLLPFAPEERGIVERTVDTAASACLHIVELGYESAMNAYNGRDWSLNDPVA